MEMWSATENKVATWTVSRRQERDAGGNAADVIIAENVGDDGTVKEALRFSPATTDDELARYVRDVNRRQNHDRNAEEVE